MKKTTIINVGGTSTKNNSTLWSGPPHNYRGKDYGPRKGIGEYVHTGDNVGVVMDTTKGELSFVVNGVNLDVAYEGIHWTSLSCLVSFFSGKMTLLNLTHLK